MIYMNNIKNKIHDRKAYFKYFAPVLDSSIQSAVSTAVKQQDKNTDKDNLLPVKEAIAGAVGGTVLASSKFLGKGLLRRIGKLK